MAIKIKLSNEMMNKGFQKNLKDELDHFLEYEKNKYPLKDTLKIDLHCHDYNSDIPDELIGRLLRVPETWISSEVLLHELERNGCSAYTITNHNNARSCYIMQDKGYDILTAAEFSCWVPDFDTGIHVLTYGFTPEQEKRLDKLRKNIYAFQEFTREHDIPTIWAHPLYHYAAKQLPPQDFFNKMLLLFERFEFLNGQRDTWQNILVKEWISQADEESLHRYSKQYNIGLTQYCNQPYRKILTGGSDSHMGIFSGMTGVYAYIPDLQKRLDTAPRSQLILEAIKEGNLAVYGSHQNTEKLTLAFLNYVCQIAMNYKDPGLIRLLLHKGGTTEKVFSVLASNVFSEVQNHKVTMSFVKLFYECMMGKKPAFYKRLLVSSAYKPVFDIAADMSSSYNKDKDGFVMGYYNSLLSINNQINGILAKRLEQKINKLNKDGVNKPLDNIISELELPTNIRAYLSKADSESKIDISGFLDGLSFPFFTSLFILAAHFTSAKALYNTRPFLTRFSKELKKHEHPKRILWMTDTYGDKNGVSIFLKQMHEQIKQRNLPIDIIVCSDNIKSDDHLIVLKPLTRFVMPAYQDQPINVPNFVELHNLFLEGEYDRIICSTEGIMGISALYLKHAYTVEASFYLHTDWLMFARKVLNFNSRNSDQVRRMLRFFYKSFDRVLVLNSDQKNWLTGSHMMLDAQKVCKTSHWVNPCFMPKVSKKSVYFGVDENTPVLLYVGRLSAEKGVLEIPDIYKQVKKVHPDTKLVIVGKGPALDELKREIPDTFFIDWVDQEKLADIYSSADILLLPSRFDTFCNVVLEAISCGLPVVAYNSKGPKDIIMDKECGFLVEYPVEMAAKISYYLGLDNKESFKTAAIKRSLDYDAETIINELIDYTGLNNE
jgi:glycosyltransferase involved in cell wall biosynthesis